MARKQCKLPKPKDKDKPRYLTVINIPSNRCDGGVTRGESPIKGVKVYHCADSRTSEGRKVVQRWEVWDKLVSVLDKPVRGWEAPMCVLARKKKNDDGDRAIDYILREGGTESGLFRHHGIIVQIPRYKDETYFLRISERSVL